MLMTFVEVVGLVVIMIIGLWYVVEGNADFAVLTEFYRRGQPDPGDHRRRRLWRSSR